MNGNPGTRCTCRRLSGAALVALCCWWAGGCIVPIQVSQVEFDGISPSATPQEPVTTPPAVSEPTEVPSEAVSVQTEPPIVVALPPVEAEPAPLAGEDSLRIELPLVELPPPTFPADSLSSLPASAVMSAPVVVVPALPVPEPADPMATVRQVQAAPLPSQPTTVPRSLVATEPLLPPPATIRALPTPVLPGGQSADEAKPQPVAVMPAAPPTLAAPERPALAAMIPPANTSGATPQFAARPAEPWSMEQIPAPKPAARSPFVPVAAPSTPSIPTMPFVPAASIPPREIPFVEATEIHAPAEVLPPGGGIPRPVPMPVAPPGELAGVQRIKSIREINIDITPPELQGDDGQRMPAPVDYASEWFAEVPVRSGDDRFERDYDYIPIPEGMEFCYQPLYFEQVNVERYGRNFGVLQPVVSAAHFYGNIPLLPYKMFAQPARRCTYHAHWSLPGYRQPWWEKRPPIISLDAAAMQGLATWGLILLIP